jgi:hypothetical protein
MLGIAMLGVVAAGVGGKAALGLLKAGQKSLALGGKSVIGKQVIRKVKDIGQKADWSVSKKTAKNFGRWMSAAESGTTRSSAASGLLHSTLFRSMSLSERAVNSVGQVGTKEATDICSDWILDRVTSASVAVLP